ncbi:carboxypeptidase-like regulatory domain-containing protein [Urechidicola sp. KH5]
MKQLFTIAIVFISFCAYSQTARLEGTVKDSVGNPLELANIIALVQGTSKVESYSITNDKGEFKLVLPTNQSYNLRISYIGFVTATDSLFIPDGSSVETRNFTLYEEENTLDDVELTFEMPVTIKGDTIVYNADSFNNGTEKKLEDVLKKLPGVEITENGEIEVEGKTVQKVMVEGKDFFDGDSKVASQNIPADAVDKIEVLRNYNEVTPMRGVGDDSDNIALNIKLKEGKKNFWFGDVKAGVGEDEGYLVHPKLFYYSPKTSINIIGDMNNIGEVPFTRQDYFRFTGGFRNIMNRGGTSFNAGNAGLGLSGLQNNMANEIETKFGAANFSYTPKEAWTISGFSIFNDQDVEMITNTIIQNIVTGTIENRTNLTRQNTKLGLFKFSSTYKPDNNTQFDYDVLLKTSSSSEEEMINSQLNDGTEENIVNRQKEKPTSVNQNLNYYKVMDDKNIFSFEAQHMYQNENPYLNFLRNNQPFEDIIPTDPETIYNMNQNEQNITSKLDAKLDYYFILNRKSNLNFTLGTTLSEQRFDSGIFQILSNGGKKDFDEPELNNDVTYNFTDLFLGVHYKAVVGKFTFTPGFNVHNYITKDQQLGDSYKQNDFNFTPDLLILFKIKQSETLRFNYRMTRQYTDINNIAEGYVLNNFNSLFQGNRYLESSLVNRYSLDFFSFSMYNFTNINAAITYTKTVDAIKNRSVFSGRNQTISEPFNSNLADETLTARANYGRRFGKFKVNGRINLSYNKFNGFVEDTPDVSESYNQNYTVSFATNFKTAPNIEVGYNKSFNDYQSSFSENKFTTDRPFARLDAVFLKHFSFVADYSYYNYSNDAGTVENKYSFLDATLFFQKTDSKWEFSVSGKNLTDNEAINRDNFVPNFSTSTSSYLVMGRRVMFNIKYNL